MSGAAALAMEAGNPRALEDYEDAFRCFVWQSVHQGLGWRSGEPVSLGWSIVDRHAGGDRVASVSLLSSGSEQRLTYRELSEASNRFANALRHLGVGQGDRVATLLPRTPETLIALLAVLKLGAIYVPIFTGFGADAVEFRLRHSGARVLVTHHSVRDRIPPVLRPQSEAVDQIGPYRAEEVDPDRNRVCATMSPRPTICPLFIFQKFNLILQTVGATLEHLVETTDYVLSTEDYQKTAAVRREFLKGPPLPAATGVVVRGLLRPDALIEIKGVAAL